ncbi:hypothetical protein WA026_010623 [Henosepilachna vigintioctopunctata]|uniref:Uncharacterized protein n=1 Tax=Henosepilachna vigintioctopunctata TaxID=420089 RepID=A0AAW1V4E1_9CUCU
MGETYDTFQAASSCNNRVDLPPVLELTKFSFARCNEIEVMRKHLAASSSGAKVAFQKLPKHMRRRAMSHNAKRLPRRLREIHLSQMKKSGLPPKQKRPSRKYRRKPSNILKEYARRKLNINWLNTHIWHAKRFHMIEKWGFKLPLSPCDKSFTACYRATKNYCLLQDISYFKCIEVSGKKVLIVNGFKKISINNNGLSITSKAFINGYRQGETTLFQYGSNFEKPIGLVDFLWKSNIDVKAEVGALWLWIHAAFYEEALKTITECFSLDSDNEKFSNLDKSITLKELKTELNRFRLIGFQSNKIVHNSFDVCNFENNLIEDFKKSFGKAEEIRKNQNLYWDEIKSISSTNSLPPHIILPLIINDPRMKLRQKQDLSEFSDSNIILRSDIPILAASPLWDELFRKTVNCNKTSDNAIAKLRSTHLIPKSNFSMSADPVPIMLIQKPGGRNDTLGYSSGWDIILPSSWAKPIWISLIMSGARCGGLREFQHNAFELDKPNFLHPDTLAGEKEDQTTSEECTKTYFRKPPNKRTNFNKYKIVSPFKFNWKLLIENWQNCRVDNFYVIRDRKKLIDLQNCLNQKKSSCLLLTNSLIPVKLECKRGVPKKFAIICLPQEKDLKKNPSEGKHHDPNQKERKLLRDQHKTMLKKLRRKRKTGKKLNKHLESVDKEELSKYSARMKQLWIPETNNVKNSCLRDVFGFISEGGFSYTLGHAKGIGYISGAAFNTFLESNLGDKVLFRNTNSRYYYAAKLSVISDL